jgi:RNA polymerase sigma-70 factor (ECF subfamily)
MDEQVRLRAVEAAYAAHADDVYRVAYAVLSDPDDAVEATQEAFARAVERWERYDDRRPVRPWLHTIVSRVAMDQLRRRRVRWLAVPALAEQAGRPSAGDYGGADPGSTVPPRQAVEQALTSLQPVARAAVLLRHRYGYDYAEIAGFLGISVSNVGAILTRARATLRAGLREPVSTERQEDVR